MDAKLLGESLVRNRIYTQNLKVPPTRYLLIAKGKIVTLQWNNLANITLIIKVNFTKNETNQHHIPLDMMP